MENLYPVIVPRDAHPISRKFISPNALRVLYRLKDEGFIAYLVGGCVRDLLLGREPKDFDVVTDATPAQIKRLFRNCRLVGRRFRLAHLHFQNEIIEVATFRAPQPEENEAPGDGDEHPPLHLKSAEGVVLRDNVFGTPAEDALRRDFTINALFYNVADFSIIDYAGGMADLAAGVVRTIGEPRVRFTEDPVRMLRAVRFAAMLGFRVQPADWGEILDLAPTITRAAPPRLYEEILKLLLLGQGEKTYQLLRQSGLFSALFPVFDAWLGTEREGFPHVRVGRSLDWVDGRIGGGEKVEPALLLALVFGEYLDELATAGRGEGLAPQDALNAAVARFLEEVAPVVSVPHRIAVHVRDILAGRERLRKTPGRRPQAFVARPSFPAVLDYLRCQVETGGGGEELLAWWEEYARSGLAPGMTSPPGTERAAEGTGRRRRRRRRPRRRGAE